MISWIRIGGIGMINFLRNPTLIILTNSNSPLNWGNQNFANWSWPNLRNYVVAHTFNDLVSCTNSGLEWCLISENSFQIVWTTLSAKPNHINFINDFLEYAEAFTLIFRRFAIITSVSIFLVISLNLLDIRNLWSLLSWDVFILSFNNLASLFLPCFSGRPGNDIIDVRTKLYFIFLTACSNLWCPFLSVVYTD